MPRKYNPADCCVSPGGDPRTPACHPLGPASRPARAGTRFASVPVRRADPARLLAAVNAQRAALGEPVWSGPVTAEALGAGCVSVVLAALDAGASPEPEALRWAVVDLLGLLASQAPGRAVE